MCTEYAQSAVLEDNEIRGNVAAVRGNGYGGGVWANALLYRNRILSNTASVHGDGYGGGTYAYHVGDFNDNLVQGNVASENGDGTGGGLYAIYLQRAQHNTIAHNVATRGGGIYMAEYLGSQALYYNHIAHNQATGSGAFDGGGGIASAADWVEIARNEVYSNTTAGLGVGGGLLITAGDRYLVRDNRFEDNEGGGGGGIAVYTATGTIVQNQIVDNDALLLGGGVYLWGQASPALDRNLVISNTAYGLLYAAGGGLLINVDGGTTVTVTNHVIARNGAGADGSGGGVYCWRGECVLINNTIVDNDQGDNQEGVILGSADGGTHHMRNNVVVGHGVGVALSSGVAILDYNDYYDNVFHVSGGATWGPHHRNDKPEFEDRWAGNYHLALTSPLIDQGDSTVNVPLDFEGDPRPRGGGMDIGADEAYRVESHVSASAGSDLTGDGSPGSPFATVTKGIAETRTGGMVHVGRGSYPERITITRSIHLFGGYHEGDWSRDVTAYVATLDAEDTGTVVLIQGEGVDATVDGFTITGGEASVYGSGGGLVVHDDAVATVRHNAITGNHARNGGGGVVLWGSDLLESVLDSNRIYNNSADGEFVPCCAAQTTMSPQQGPEPGGGVLLGEGPARVVNNWIYSNTAAGGGDGMAVLGWGGPARVLHNTVVDNGGSSGVGIELMGAASAAILHDNLIVGHGTGISATGGEAAWDYNGFYDNVTAYAPGLPGGAHDTHGDPRFADRSGADYHIDHSSPMAGAGVDKGVEIDLDGDPRPLPAGTRPDLGADECEQRRVYLPLVLREGG